MVQADISTQTRLLASNFGDVASIMSHPTLGDCMIVDESSSLCDGIPQPLCDGTEWSRWYTWYYTASCQVGSNHPTLADVIKSLESLRKDRLKLERNFA